MRSAENIFRHKRFDRTVSLVQAHQHCRLANFQVNSNSNLGVAIMAWTREPQGIYEKGRLRLGKLTMYVLISTVYRVNLLPTGHTRNEGINPEYQ